MKDYPVEVQRLFLEIMLQDAQSFVRVQNIYNLKMFLNLTIGVMI